MSQTYKWHCEGVNWGGFGRRIKSKSNLIFLTEPFCDFRNFLIFNVRSFLLSITEKKCHIIYLCRQNAGMDRLQVIRDVCSCRILASTWKCIMSSAKLPFAVRMYGAAQSSENACTLGICRIARCLWQVLTAEISDVDIFQNSGQYFRLWECRL